MVKSSKKLSDEVRATYVNFVREALAAKDEEVLVTASNELALPVVDSEGNERWVVVSVKVPTGERNGAEYDGYAAAQDYAMRQEARTLKAKEKERKAAADKAKREAKAAKKNGEQ